LSNFNISNGNFLRELREDKPLPKSSIESLKPKRLISLMSAGVKSSPSLNALSVISTSIRLGLMTYFPTTEISRLIILSLLR
jgi:hypothetical protein